MTPSIESALNDLVSAIRTELRAEFLSALGGEGRGSSVGRRGRVPGRLKKAATRARAKGAKRTPEELEALTASVLSFIKKNPASRVEQIAAGLGMTSKELALPIGKLWNAGLLKVQGQRRGMKYTAK
jgi:hypothetical protein